MNWIRYHNLNVRRICIENQIIIFHFILFIIHYFITNNNSFTIIYFIKMVLIML